MALEIVALPNGNFAENCYLVADTALKKAAVVDPGEDAAMFLEALEARGWSADAIWLTHAHVDHVAGVKPVKDATGAPVWLHPADRPLYDHATEQALMFGLRIETPPPPDHALGEGSVMRIGEFAFDVLHTPGHSPGSVTFAGHGVLLVGDVLFAGSVGRTDLPGGDTSTLVRSIREKLYTFGADTRVLPGHGPETTIGAEMRGNAFVRGS